jgi:hypothetical protein
MVPPSLRPLGLLLFRPSSEDLDYENAAPRDIKKAKFTVATVAG